MSQSHAPAQMCEPPAPAPDTSLMSVDTSQSNADAQDQMCFDPSISGGTSSGGGETDWWKTAPKLEIPWPPGADKQSKHAISWDKGPAYQLSFPEAKWPSDGRETLFEAPPVQVQTPVPGVVLDLFAKAEYGLAFGGAVGLAIQKTGDEAYKVTGQGTVTGKAAIGVSGGVGVGLGGAGVSIGVSGNLAAALEASLSGSIRFAVTYDAGAWSGTLDAPLKFETVIKVTPSAALYVKVWKWNKELATLSFGEWTIATAGAEWTPGVRLAGDGFTNMTTSPRLIGPTWGAAPEAKEA